MNKIIRAAFEKIVKNPKIPEEKFLLALVNFYQKRLQEMPNWNKKINDLAKDACL